MLLRFFATPTICLLQLIILFAAWLTTNIEGCSKKRIHETDKNPMAGLVGLRLKIIPENEQPL